MKLILIKSNLKDGISLVERVCGDSLHLPILKNIFIKADDGKIRLTATNLEIAVTAFVSGKIIEDGSITVPAGLFSSLITTLTSERINIAVNKNECEVKTDNYEATLQGLLSDDFPLIPKIKNTTDYFEFKGGVLQDALREVVISAQTTSVRPELNSVFFNFTLETMKLVATDAARLSEKTIGNSQFKTNREQGISFLLPLRTAQEVLRITREDDVIRIYNDPNQILFACDRFEIISRLVESSFPEYTAIIPKECDAEMTVHKEEFINALKLVGILGNRTSEVRIKIAENNKSIEVFSADQSIGKNTYTLSVKASGKPLEISFNWKFLIDGLKAFNGEDVIFCINEHNKPALFKSPQGESYFYVVMPLLKT